MADREGNRWLGLRGIEGRRSCYCRRRMSLKTRAKAIHHFIPILSASAGLVACSRLLNCQMENHPNMRGRKKGRKGITVEVKREFERRFMRFNSIKEQIETDVILKSKLYKQTKTTTVDTLGDCVRRPGQESGDVPSAADSRSDVQSML